MALTVTGYVLEPPRLGRSNSPFTLSPNALVSDQVAFDAAYPSDESVPRTEYMAQVLREVVSSPTGPGGTQTLPDALIGWTWNEGVVQSGLQVPFQRFDYSGRDQRFKLLQGAPREEVGTLAADSNVSRLAVSSTPTIADIAAFPIRIGLGDTDSGDTFAVTLVDDDVDFGAPAAGTVELSLATGNLNWAAADLTTNVGKTVRFQRQAFFTPEETNGNIGVIGTDTLVLNPLPTTGQTPALSFGSRLYVTVVEVADEASFSLDPAAGTVEWAVTTGLLKLHSGDLIAFAGQPLVYDGVFTGTFQVPTNPRGTVDAPTAVSPLPSEDSDLYFRIPGVHQFAETVFVDSLSPITDPGKRGQVEVERVTGNLKFSLVDQATYAGQTVESVNPDIELERGITLRLFRTPADPGATTDEAKDVTAIYTRGEEYAATIADPIIGAPFANLPALPLDDQPLVVRVDQGTGSFTTGAGGLNRLDGAVPVAGKGYVIDFDDRQLIYGERKENVIYESGSADFGALQLTGFPVFSTNLTIEQEDAVGAGTYTLLTQGVDYVIDLNSGTVSFTRTDGSLLVESSVGSVDTAHDFSDTTQDFGSVGVVAGDLLVIESGANAGVYTVSAVGTTVLTVSEVFPSSPEGPLAYQVRRGNEVLADRYWRTVPPLDPNLKVERINNIGTASNSPRLNINSALADQSRFRFGKTGGLSTAVVQPDDASFTSPTSLSSGTVEISEETGNLNFSSIDLGATIYWVRGLVLGTDFRVQGGLGFIEFAERMLELEEILLSYATIDENGNKVVVSNERGTFLVSKEVTQDHPTPTTTLSYNPDGREVAENPSPRAWRGGRPQITGEQVTFNVAASSMTFLNDNQVTDALPSGSSIGPEETVYVDYYLHEAIGGEKNLTVLQPPIATVQIVIEDGAASFTIEGDRTADFSEFRLLRVNGQETYLLAAPTYDGVVTTINLDQGIPQAFKSDLNNPTLEVTSGTIRRVASGSSPSYFVTETNGYDPVPRGSTIIFVVGDVTSSYGGGTIVLFTDGSTFQDYGVVEGATYNEGLGRTEVKLSGGVLQQYSSPIVLARSVRAVLPDASADVQTQNAPLLDQPVTVYRKIEGEPGMILVSGVDYTIDESGRTLLTDPLAPNEEIGILYTGLILVEAGIRHRISWSFVLAPSVDNGLLNQVLRMEYSTYIPDTFFWRVETFTNFRGELSDQLTEEAQGNSPSQGPILENTGQPTLFEEGVEGLWYPEGRLANEDIVARATLKFYNDAINFLEDYLQQVDGRVVGDRDGRFLFDGDIDNPQRASFADATNQIDDEIVLFQSVYPGIPTITTPAYRASATSRFFPTSRRSIGRVEQTPTDTGDVVYSTGYAPLTSLSSPSKRYPFAMIVEDVPAGTATFNVDDASGSDTFFRPPLDSGMEVFIVDQDGNVLDNTGKTIFIVAGNSVVLSGGMAADIPAGSTLRLTTTDTSYNESYAVGISVSFLPNEGLVTYLDTGSFLPFASPPPIPQAGDDWNTTVGTSHQGTEPFRFPALDGGVSDDDGDIQTAPILTPQARSEIAVSPLTGSPLGTGLLSREATAIADIQTQTTGTARLTGTVSPSTVITLDSGTFAVQPLAGDMVRVMTGANAGSDWVRVIGSTANSVTLASALTVDTSIEFLTSATVPVSSGTTPDGVVGTLFTDSTANFITDGVIPGMTLVFASGSNANERRQIAAVTTTTLVLATAPSNADTGFDYRVSDYLGSFSGSSLTQWTDALSELEGVLVTDSDSETNSLEAYVDSVGTDVVTSTLGSTSASTLTDTSQDFDAAGVTAQDFIFVRTGANAGFYEVTSVTDANNLEVTPNFPSAVSGMNYRVLDTTGVSLDGLTVISEVLQNVDTAESERAVVIPFTATVSVTGDPGAYANGVESSTLTNRGVVVLARITQAADDAGSIEAVLSSVDRLYDTRFVWIDSRINLETGLLEKKRRAVSTREANLRKITKSLTKLLVT